VFWVLDHSGWKAIKGKEVGDIMRFSILHHVRHLYYYATETAFTNDQKAHKDRLLMLMNDALILAKRVSPFV
jgi:hypothetical protein